MKYITIGLSALLGTFASLSAIERPGEKKSTPPQPQGGVLGDDQKNPQIEEIPQVAPQIIEEKAAYLGVGGREASEALLIHLELKSGLLLSTIDPQSPAGLAGLKAHDIIVSVGEDQLTDQDSLRVALADKKPGEEVALKIIRRGKTVEQNVTLGVAPARLNLRPQLLIPNQAAELNQLLNEQLGNALDGFGDNDLQKELMEQLDKAFGDDRAGGGFRDLKMNFQQLGSMRLEDEEGSIEMKMSDGKRELSIRDKAGKLLFEGPYDTEIDKAAVPEEYKERVERLGGGNGSSFQFKLNGRDLFGGQKGKGE